MFDTTINRWGTHSAKWDLLAAHLGDDALSLSVADMEFATCPEVSRAIEDACAEGIFGYTEVFDDSARQQPAGRSVATGGHSIQGMCTSSRVSSNACPPCARSSCRGLLDVHLAW